MIAVQQIKEELTKLAAEIGEIQVQQKMDEPLGQFVSETLRCGLMQVTLEWAQQKPFKDIVLNTGAHEGIIVRTFQRLDEMLTDLIEASDFLGSSELKEKLERVSKLIRRDIVFAPSLYTIDDEDDHSESVQRVYEE